MALTTEQTTYNEALNVIRAEYDKDQMDQQGKIWPPIPYNLTRFAKAVRQLNDARVKV
jgi:hypothetical protein